MKSPWAQRGGYLETKLDAAIFEAVRIHNALKEKEKKEFNDYCEAVHYLAEEERAKRAKEKGLTYEKKPYKEETIDDFHIGCLDAYTIIYGLSILSAVIIWAIFY